MYEYMKLFLYKDYLTETSCYERGTSFKSNNWIYGINPLNNQWVFRSEWKLRQLFLLHTKSSSKNLPTQSSRRSSISNITRDWLIKEDTEVYLLVTNNLDLMRIRNRDEIAVTRLKCVSINLSQDPSLTS